MYKSFTSLVKLSLFMAISQVVLNHFAQSLSSETTQQRISCQKEPDRYWSENSCQLRKKPI
jgi:hypothetical protein